MMRVAWIVAFVALLALIPRFAAVESTAQAPASAALEADPIFMCPMHPDVRGASGDKCSKCGMAMVRAAAADYQPYLLDFKVIPEVLRPRQRGRVRFLVRNPKDGSTIQQFETVHERIFHLFVVSQDLEYFTHIHPEKRANGTLDVDVTLPRAGAYQLIADFVPTGAAPQFLQRALVTAGYTGSLTAHPTLVLDEGAKVVDGTGVELLMSPPVAGREQLITFQLTDSASHAPALDLEPYLGATGHLLAASDDLSAVFHSHPVAGITSFSGPTIVFQVLFPRAGNYRLWAQFQRHRRVSTVSFTIPVQPRE